MSVKHCFIRLIFHSFRIAITTCLLLVLIMNPVDEVSTVKAEEGQEPVTSTSESECIECSSDYYASYTPDSSSQFGPYHTSPDYSTPEHAYSPFAEKVEPYQPAPEDYVSDQVLIKLKEQVFTLDYQSMEYTPNSEATRGLLSEYGISNLERVFSIGTPGFSGETSPQDIEPPVKPPSDLSRWYKATTPEGTEVLDVVKTLSEDPIVEVAEPNYVRKLAALPDATTDPLYDDQWHLDTVNAPEAWQFLADNGTNPGGWRDVVVAVIDSGVDCDHPDLASNIWVNSAEFNGTPGVDDDGNGFVDDIHGVSVVSNEHSGNPDDDHGHGTHVAGIIAASANNSEGGVGIAYNTQIMPIKAAQYSGVLATSDIAEAIYYAIDKGADIINMSFGGYTRSQLEEDALAVAFGQAVLVAAAGNDGMHNEWPCKYPIPPEPMYPSALTWVLGVMASTESDNLASFSNYDCTPHTNVEYEVMAPGVDIMSTLPDGQYAAWDGTSMAAPVVSGIAALVRSYFRDKDVYSSRFIMGQIAETGSKSGAYYIPDAYAALTTFPEPSLSYLEHWLFDTENQSAGNDSDGIVDAGETIDLAIVIRNHWSKADNVTVNLRAWNGISENDDPYVTMITSNVSYGAVGSFNTDDNGFIYDGDGVITGVSNPFTFNVSSDTPNDHVIPFYLTMTCVNGYQPTANLTFTSSFNLMVQKGREIPSIISGADVFGNKIDYTTETEPRSITSADFNGDNFTDIAVCQNANEGILSVFMNNGDGTFAERVNYTDIPWIQVIKSGDFNGDTFPDIAIIRTCDVLILPNNGDGTFNAYTQYYIGICNFNSVAAADLNSDNFTDLVVQSQNSNGKVVVLMNDGAGNFNSVVSYPVGKNPKYVVAADFNGDSHPDVAAMTYDQTIDVLLNNGDGTLSEKIVNEIVCNFYSSFLVAADIDGDLYADLVVADDQKLQILLGNGDGSFTAGGEYSNNFYVYSMSTVDLNSDSSEDIVICDNNDDRIIVLMNLGDGNFAPKGLHTTGDGPYSMTIADFNGDGLPDVASVNVGDSSVSILTNTGEVSLEPDMVLTKDYFWIIPDQVLIDNNAIVVVEPGTQIQFWAGDPDDPYSQQPNAFLQVEGTLLVQGTQEEPVEMFPDALWSNKVVQINTTQIGVTELRYARVTNPYIGKNNYNWEQEGLTKIVDHCYFDQDVVDFLYYWNTEYTQWHSTSPVVRSRVVSNSIFHKMGVARAWDDATNYYYGFGVYDNAQGNLYDSCRLYVYGNDQAEDNVFLKNYRIAYGYSGEKYFNSSRAEISGYRCDTCNATSGREGNQFKNNAVLNRWWDPDISHWMQFYSWERGDSSYTRDNIYYLSDNYWTTTSSVLLDAAIVDFNDNFNKAEIVYTPVLTSPPESAYPFVTGVVLTQGGENTTSVGPGSVTFTVTFNRDMDTSVEPKVSFGPDLPVTDYTVHSIGGGWQDARTWQGTFNINPVTGDGYQLVRITDAVAVDDPWLITGDDSERFRFEIITSGTEAMNLQANGLEGSVNLTWTQDDFDMLAGFNLYRSDTSEGTYSRINETVLPPQQSGYSDTDVEPGQTYYYKFTVVKTDMTESDFSNVATGTPLDTISPVITHQPVSGASIGLPLQIYADVTDNVHIDSVTLYYRAIGETAYSTRAMVYTTGDRYSATLEGSLVTSAGLEYYIEASDGLNTASSGRSDLPWQVLITDQPVVTSVSPGSGSVSGGTFVTISGSNFKVGASALFGTAVAGNVTVINDNQITCNTPAHIPEVVDVTVKNTDNQTGTLLQAFNYVSETATLSLPDSGGDSSAIVQIPVSAVNIQGLVAASLKVSFDNNVLTPLDVNTGSLTPGWSLAANTAVLGEVSISMASPGSAVSGSGNLVFIEFEVTGSAGNTTTLNLSDVLLNDGAIPVETSDGSFQVSSGLSVSGTVRFWSDSLGIPGVLLTLEDGRVYAGLSQLDGTYSITGMPEGTYTLTPEKSENTNAITSYDASLVLQHDVGMITLSGYSETAGDVNKSGAVNSMDAYYILQKSVGLITLPFPGAGVVWEFEPASRSYSPLDSDQTNQDFTGILLGDVSGNWASGGEATSFSMEFTQTSIPNSMGTARLKMDKINSLPSTQVTVPLNLELDGGNLYGADIVLTYDSSVLSVVSVNTSALLDGFTTAVNLNQAGEIRLASAGANPVSSSGEMLTITFDVIGVYGDISTIDIITAALNENSIPSETTSGGVAVINSGDANCDSEVSVLDMTKVARIILSMDEGTLVGDVNLDGVINVLDMTKIARIILGLDS